MNKVLAVTVGMSMLFVGPAYAECSADDLITPIVPVATGYDTNGALGGSWTVIDTFKQNQDTVCINQSQTENFAPHGMLWVEYKSGLGNRQAIVVEKEWQRVSAPAAAHSLFDDTPANQTIVPPK
jgi:hypothetical protein